MAAGEGLGSGADSSRSRPAWGVALSTGDDGGVNQPRTSGGKGNGGGDGKGAASGGDGDGGGDLAGGGLREGGGEGVGGDGGGDDGCGDEGDDVRCAGGSAGGWPGG